MKLIAVVIISTSLLNSSCSWAQTPTPKQKQGMEQQKTNPAFSRTKDDKVEMNEEDWKKS